MPDIVGTARAAMGALTRDYARTRTARGAAITDLGAGVSGLENTREGLEQACKEFESLLVYQVIREMRKTVEENPLFHGGAAEEMFQGFLDMETARSVSQSGGFGLWRTLYDQLARQLPEDESSSILARAAKSYARTGVLPLATAAGRALDGLF